MSRLRGNGFANIRAWTVEHHGEAGWAEVLGALDPDERASLADLRPSDWYPLALQAPHPMLGQQGLCTNLRAPEGGGYKAHNFLCNEWSGAQGASVAREGQKADDLPGDLYAKHGDGN